MSITVTAADTASTDVFARIVAMKNLLEESDSNFEGVPMHGERGAATTVADADNTMHAKLLRLLVEDTLKAAPGSMLGFALQTVGGSGIPHREAIFTVDREVGGEAAQRLRCLRP